MHYAWRIICGVSEPTYSKSELKKLKKEDKKTFEYEGKKYTHYEASQVQRKLETRIRYEKDKIIALRSAGFDEEARVHQARLNSVMTQYKRFSDKAGLPYKKERMSVSKYRRIKANDEFKKVLVSKSDNMNYMSASFKPEFGTEKTLTYGESKIPVKKVNNSEFELYADADATRRNKAVRITEKNLKFISKNMPVDVEIKNVAVIDFEKQFNEQDYKTDAIAGYDKESGIVYINSKYDTKEKIQNFLNKNKGYFANNTELAPYMHEFGHKFYEDCIKTLAKNKNISYNRSKLEIEGAIHDYIHKNDDDGLLLLSNLGRHAYNMYKNNQFAEIIAECCTISENKVANDIIKILKEMIKK